MRKSIFVPFLLTVVSLAAQGNFPHGDLQKILSELAQSYKIPNLAVAITNKDSLIFQFSGSPKGINDLYLIGSTSKSFTALSILQLADKGLVDIYAPVHQYLPWFSFKNETNDKPIKVQHLLNQTSGLPQEGGYFDLLTSDLGNFEAALKAHINKLEPANGVDEGWQYSNLNYTLLGLIVQKASGISFKDYTQKYIFQPLNMSRTFADYGTTVENGLTQGYQYAFFMPFAVETPEYSAFKVPQGYIASTAKDMTSYLRAAMKNTEGVALKDSSYHKWIMPHKAGYAMGWGETHYFDQPIIQHLGLTETFCSALFFMPKQEYGVVVLANTSSNEFAPAAKEAIILTLLNKPFSTQRNMENTHRWLVFIFVILNFLAAVAFFFKWKRVHFEIQRPKMLTAIFTGLCFTLCVLPVFVLPKIFGINIFDMAKYSPDFAFGFIGIAIFGATWTLIATFRKKLFQNTVR